MRVNARRPFRCAHQRGSLREGLRADSIPGWVPNVIIFLQSALPDATRGFSHSNVAVRLRPLHQAPSSGVTLTF